MSNKNT